MSIDKKEMYRAVPMSITTPEFYVLYNGVEDYPEKSVIKLSDLFKVKNNKKYKLELIVTVYNVNKGYNKKIMEHSKTLNEYAEFVAKVREYKESSGLDTTESLKKAIEDCVRNNILREFLKKHGGEIMNLLSREFDIDLFIEAREEDAREEIAENLLKDGMSKEFVVKNTGLSTNQVEKVIQRMNRKK
jgi:hypothetical protein